MIGDLGIADLAVAMCSDSKGKSLSHLTPASRQSPGANDSRRVVVWLKSGQSTVGGADGSASRQSWD